MKRIREEGRVPLGPSLPLATPFVINVDPSSLCNLECKFCFHAARKTGMPKGIMDWGLYKRIISSIKEFASPIKTLRLYAFGEPLLNSHFADMVAFAKDLGVAEDIDTTTNGTAFSPKYSRAIIGAGIDRINISVVGVNEDQYMEFSNRRIDFSRYVDNIADLYANRGNCVIFIKINGDVISKDDQQKFLEIFTPISDGCAVEHVMDCWYGIDMGDIKRNENVGVYGQQLTHVSVCPYIFYSFCVQYDGEISACFLDWNRRLTIGDVWTRSVKEVWNGAALRGLRKAMLCGKRRGIPVCKNCNQLIAGQPENIDHLAEALMEKL